MHTHTHTHTHTPLSLSLSLPLPFPLSLCSVAGVLCCSLGAHSSPSCDHKFSCHAKDIFIILKDSQQLCKKRRSKNQTILRHCFSLPIRLFWAIIFLKRGPGCPISPSTLEFLGCHLIPLSYLLSCCLVLLPFLWGHVSAGPFPGLCLRKFSNIFVKNKSQAFFLHGSG